tara:strand:+ start:140 stop:790 length:651 start_codon:yes stop_codon:yes gene_type:complete
MKKEIILVSLLSIGVSPSAFAYPIVDIYDFRQITSSGDWRSTIGKFNCKNGDIKITNYEISKEKSINLMFDTWYSKEGVREMGRYYASGSRSKDLEQGEENYGSFVALTKEKCDPKSSRVIAFDRTGMVLTTENIKKDQENYYNSLDSPYEVRWMYNCRTHRITGPKLANRWMTTNQFYDYMIQGNASRGRNRGRGDAWGSVLNTRSISLAACIFR